MTNKTIMNFNIYYVGQANFPITIQNKMPLYKNKLNNRLLFFIEKL